MALDQLRDALIEEMRDIYDAEHRIADALPKMRDKASNPKLSDAFGKHLGETAGQIERLERAFEAVGEKPKREPCEATKGLIEEGEELMGKKADDEVMDALLIGAAQKVEHYEIASYGTLCAWAELLGLDKVRDLLGKTLEQEETTDKDLSEIALAGVNEAAAA